MSDRPFVFARTRHTYDSYSDMWQLVKLAEFPTCFVDEIDLRQPVTYITSPFTGETRGHLANQRGAVKDPVARVVWWNLERPDTEKGMPEDAMREAAQRQTDELLALVDAIWVSDRYYASLDPRYQFVILGSDARLAGHEPIEPKHPTSYDVIHLSYITYRRKFIYDALRRSGITIAPNGWGNERDRALRASRCMLNVHQTPSPVGEPLRFALAAAYKLALMTETLAAPDPLVPSYDCAMAPAEDIAQNTMEWVRSEAENHAAVSDRLGERLHETLCVKHPFAQEVRAAVAAMDQPRKATE